MKQQATPIIDVTGNTEYEPVYSVGSTGKKQATPIINIDNSSGTGDNPFEDSELPGGGLKLNNSALHLTTNEKWISSEGHLSDVLRLQWTAPQAKPAVSWCDENGDNKAAIIAHKEANDPTTPDHTHLSIETTNSNSKELHTRMEFPYDNDVCEIQTHQSNFTVHNGKLRVGLEQGATGGLYLSRVGKKADHLNEDGSVNYSTYFSPRFALRLSSAVESGLYGGSDVELVRYNNNGVVVDTAVCVTRSNNYVGIGTKTPTSGLDVAVGNSIRIRNKKTPITSTDTGVAGTVCWDDNYIYVCVATDTWKRTLIEEW